VNRIACVKKPIASSMHMARDISKFKCVLKQGLSQLRNLDGDHFIRFRDNLRTVFVPVFRSHVELERDLSAIRIFLKDSFSKMFDEKNAKLVYDQCIRILEQSGAMALFGTLNSTLNALR
jgi:hypothetical protein